MMFLVLLFVCAHVAVSVRFDIIAESPDETILIKHNLRGDDAVFRYKKHINTYTLYDKNVDWSVKPRESNIEHAKNVSCKKFDIDKYYDRYRSAFWKQRIDLYCCKKLCTVFDFYLLPLSIFCKEKCNLRLASWHQPRYRPIQVSTTQRHPSTTLPYPGREQHQESGRPDQKRKGPVTQRLNSTTMKLHITTVGFYAGKPTKEQTTTTPYPHIINELVTFPDDLVKPSSSSVSQPLNHAATTESNNSSKPILNFPSVNHFTPELENTENQYSISEKNFTLRMIQAFKETNPDKNLLFSPLSIKTVIKVLEEGAEGETKNKISKVLQGLSKPSKSQHTTEGDVFIRIATAVFYQYKRKIKEEFSRSLTDLNAQIIDIDFSRGNLSNHINDGWVKYYTGGRITKIVDPSSIDPLTQLLLLNAVYFEGKWQHGFDPERSQISNFTRSDGTTIKAVLMRSAERQLYRAGCYHSYKLCMVELPYRDSPYVMQVLLPDENVTLSEMDELLTDEGLQKMEDDLEKRNVELFLPKFRYKLKVNLKDVLSKLGLEDLFTIGDFSGIFQGGPGFEKIEDLRHAASIDVTEDGTVASAVTALQVISLKYEPSLKIRVDRPFLFFIYNRKTKQYLFVGRIM